MLINFMRYQLPSGLFIPLPPFLSQPSSNWSLITSRTWSGSLSLGLGTGVSTMGAGGVEKPCMI